MRSLLCSFIAVALCPLWVGALAAQQDVRNVAAFGRLYGVVRWFYPGDAAAALDWDRFAVHGVSRVRGARTPAELEKTLVELFAPLGPGIHIAASLPARQPAGGRDASLIAWHHRGAGISTLQGPYSMRRTNRVAPTRREANAVGVMMQMLGADTLRGRTIRMTGRARVANPDAAGWAGLWLRVDRGQQGVGFFDNMQDRPVRDTSWRAYVIEGPIASDATQIAFGVLTTEDMTVDVDGIELVVGTEGGTWTPLSIADPSFEDTSRSGGGWRQNGSHSFTRSATGAAHGDRFARVAPPDARSMARAVPPADSVETPVAGASVDVELTRGLMARVPLSLTDAEARVPETEPPALAALRVALVALGNVSRRSDTDVRLADVVVAWSAFRHFYPYWSDIGVDWDARLVPQLQTALDAAATRDDHLNALRSVVAELQDGHGSVRDAAVPARIGRLPLQFRLLGERPVVTESGDSAVAVGSVVAAIDGMPVGERVTKETRLASGSLQWRQVLAAIALRLCKPATDVTLTIEPPNGGARDVRLPCSGGSVGVVESRPDSIAELEPGVWYVDLTRVREAQLREVMSRIATARGVVFDVRGYPTDAGAAILPHLMTAREDSSDRWMHVSRITGPFGQVAAWQSFSWNLQPDMPRIAGQRVFLTDGSAISYAESVMGYVRDHKLGTIVGGSTAGANGNVAGFAVPGGFAITFTGMRVTRHDGRTPFHMVGVTPDIPLEPTLAGIRAGRDEVLERALSILRVQP